MPATSVGADMSRVSIGRAVRLTRSQFNRVKADWTTDQQEVGRAWCDQARLTCVVSVMVSIGCRKSTTCLRPIPGNHAVCQRVNGTVPYFDPSDGCLTRASSGPAHAARGLVWLKS